MNVNKININQSEPSYYIASDIYDVSYHNNGATFESLSALLNDSNLSTLIPTAVRCGGMTIRFIQSSNNKYVQYRLMSDEFSTTVADWEGVDDEPTAISDNLVKSGGVFSSISIETTRATAVEKAIESFVSGYNSGHLKLASTDNGSYFNKNGNKASLDAYSIAYLTVIGTVRYIYVEARIGAWATIQFFDGSDYSIGQFVGINGNEGVVSTKSYIEVPEGCVKIGISYVRKYGLVYGVRNIEDRLTTNELVIESETTRAQAAEKTIESFVSDYNSGHLTLTSTENGFYLNTEGNKIDMDAYSIAYLTVIDTVRYFYVEARIGAGATIQFFDETDSLIGQGVKGIYDGSGITTKSYISVPEGCKKIGVSYVSVHGLKYGTKNIEDRLTANEIAIEGIENANWKGKKIGLLGDSIAAGASASNVKYSFINVAATILGATVKNVAIGGWYLGDYENKSIYKQINGVSPSTKSLDGDEDVIVIFAGTNDFGHAFPIGEPFTIDENGHKIPSTEETTTCGGLVKTIQTLYEKYNGYIPILICTPIQRLSKGSYSNGGSWDKNDIGKYMDEYIDAIIKTATYYGIPVADFYHNNMNPNVSAANTMYFADGLHPNDEGHRLIGVQLAKEIKEKIYL